MDDLELNLLWKEYDRKLEESRVLNLQSWAVNRQTFEWLQAHRAASRLRPMGVFKGRVAVLGIVWVAFLALLVVGNHGTNPFFTASVAILLLFNLYAVIAYLQQRKVIRNIDFGDSILQTQQQLSALQASTLRVTRILILQTPFYSTWFWSRPMIASPAFWAISVPVVLAFAAGSIWLYRNITLANANKKWFRLLFNGIEWKPILQAMDHLREIEEFRSR
jgi:hypothetical protein